MLITPYGFCEKHGLDIPWADLLDDLPTWGPTPFDPRKEIPPRRHYGAGHYWGGNVSLIVAPGGVGKSSFGIGEGLGLANGRAIYGGGDPPRALNVWYLNCEDEPDEAQRRVAATAAALGLSTDRFYLDSTRDEPLIVARSIAGGGASINRAAVNRLVEGVSAAGIHVLIVDPLVATHAVNENDNGAINAVLSAYREVAHRTGCAVMLVHHSTKAARSGDVGVEQSRGASSLIDGARSVRFLTPMSVDDGRRFGISDPRGHVRVTTGKANLTATPPHATWFRLDNHDLPNGDGVGVAHPWSLPGPVDVSEDQEREILRRISEGQNRVSRQSPDWAGHPVAAVLQCSESDPRVKESLSRLEKEIRLKRDRVRVNGKDIPIYTIGDGYAELLP